MTPSLPTAFIAFGDHRDFSCHWRNRSPIWLDLLSVDGFWPIFLMSRHGFTGFIDAP